MEKLIGITLLTCLIVEYAAPIRWIKVYFGISEQDNPKQMYKIILQKLFNCALCLGFWLGLIFYLNTDKFLYMAAIISFTSEIAYRSLNILLTKYLK